MPLVPVNPPSQANTSPHINDTPFERNKTGRKGVRKPTTQSTPYSATAPAPSRIDASTQISSLYKEASELGNKSSSTNMGFSNRWTARANYFEQIHKLSFEESLVTDEADKAYRVDVLKLVNALDYSDLNVLQNNLSTTPRMAVEKLKHISKSASNSAQTHAIAFLQKHIHIDAHNKQRWWAESVKAKQATELSLFFGSATAVSVAAQLSSSAGLTTARFLLSGAGAVVTTAARIPNFYKNKWDARADQNENKLDIMKILLTQRKSGIDALDSIYIACEKKGILNDDYSSEGWIDQDNLTAIREIFSKYEPSQAYHLYSRDAPQDNIGKKCIGKLVLGDQVLEMDKEVARLLSDIKDLGLDRVLRGGGGLVYNVPSSDFRPRTDTSSSVASTSHLGQPTLTGRNTRQRPVAKPAPGIGV